MTTQPNAPGKGMSYTPSTLSVAEFEKLMQQKGGYEKIDPTVMATALITLQAIENRKTDPLSGYIEMMILDGDPGTGKSFLAAAIAKTFGGRKFTHIGNPDADHTELIRAINPAEVAKAMASGGMNILDDQGNSTPVELREEDIYFVGKLLEAYQNSHKEFTVLLFDEGEKNRFSVQTALLTLLQDGEIPLPGKVLPEDGIMVIPNGPHSQIVRARRDNLLIMIAKNKERDLYDATMRRGRVIYVDYPSAQKELEILARAFESKLPYNTARELRRIVKAASLLRNDPGITKKPSHPEVRRLIEDFILIAQNNVRLEQSRTNPDQSVYRSDLGKKVLTQLYVNGLVQRQEEQPRAAKILGDVRGAGPGFLKAILRAMYEGKDHRLFYS